MIQVLASEDGIKNVPQARVVDLLDTIEKWVKKKEVSMPLSLILLHLHDIVKTEI